MFFSVIWEKRKRQKICRPGENSKVLLSLFVVEGKVAAVDRERVMVKWCERLETLVRGEVWKGEEQNEVKVNESVLQQLVSQGFPENAARVRPHHNCLLSLQFGHVHVCLFRPKAYQAGHFDVLTTANIVF